MAWMEHRLQISRVTLWKEEKMALEFLGALRIMDETAFKFNKK